MNCRPLFPAPGGIRLLAVLLCGLWPHGDAQAQANPTVHEIRFEVLGDQPVARELIQAQVGAQAGQPLDRAQVARDLQALRAAERFSFAEVTFAPGPDSQSIVLVYRVQPRPRLRELHISGADWLGVKRVREQLDLERGAAVDDGILAARAVKLRAYYREKLRPFMEASWVIRPTASPGFVDVDFLIDEGRAARVRRIDFEGGEAVAPKTAQAAMQTQTRNWLSWITGRGSYDGDVLAMDLARVRQLYMNEGYLDAQVGPPVVEPVGRNGVALRIPVRQGTQYRLRSFDFEGVSLFPAAEIGALLPFKVGEVLSAGEVTAARRAIIEYYGERGYFDTRVDERLRAAPAQGLADLHFVISEGQPGYVRDVLVRGNTRTQDRVIRREVLIAPGDKISWGRLRTSENRLRNLGFFSEVDSQFLRTEQAGLFDIAFNVKEQKTGTLSVGAGFSSIDQVVGFIELGQGNFDIFGWPHFTGAGQKFRVRLQLGNERSDLDVSFTEPWFLGRRLALDTGFFMNDERFLSDDYSQKNIGASAGLTRAVFPATRLSGTYSWQQYDVYDVATNVSELIRREEGTRTRSAFTLALTRDTRNHPFLPSRGSRWRLAGTLAGGPLGGETDIYRLDLRGANYFPLWFGHVLILRGEASVVDYYGDSEWVPIFDRLFMGGLRTVRGFKFRDVGPKDELGEPIGGRSSLFGSAEYTIPVWKAIRLAGFYDAGQVWLDAYTVESDFNTSVGVGIRFDIPGFPLQFNYAWPQETDEINKRRPREFSFLLGIPY
ncbi:MAG: outer membrane protein assembly factor BamA [Candidatus Marinimicrobia bacterium]|nr:outer membrane protein assembly factor BamA [Candidatus Neomarinimicrobiota bacterium]